MKLGTAVHSHALLSSQIYPYMGIIGSRPVISTKNGIVDCQVGPFPEEIWQPLFHTGHDLRSTTTPINLYLQLCSAVQERASIPNYVLNANYHRQQPPTSHDMPC